MRFKHLCRFFLIAALSAGFAACGDDDDDDDWYNEPDEWWNTDSGNHGNNNDYGYGDSDDNHDYGNSDYGNNDQGGDANQGGGNSGGSQSGPLSAPTGLTVSADGPSSAPYALLRWNAVAGAMSYIVYRSSSANGSYSQVGTVSYTAFSDEKVQYTKTYYYKVKASNGSQTSDFSDYAVCEFSDRRKPGLAQFGNCTVSGTSMTLRWTIPTGAEYGKPTSILVKAVDPYTGDAVTVQTLGGTATSATFSISPFVASDGFVKVGVVLENENGTGGSASKVYDYNNNKWIY